MLLPENEKQVYHEFEEITSEAKDFRPSVIPEDYESKFDIHRLITDGPKGMDPC